MEVIHVLPINDLKPHVETERCKCEPQLDTFKNGSRVVVHNAFDGREFWEIDTPAQLLGYGEV